MASLSGKDCLEDKRYPGRGTETALRNFKRNYTGKMDKETPRDAAHYYPHQIHRHIKWDSGKAQSAEEYTSTRDKYVDVVGNFRIRRKFRRRETPIFEGTPCIADSIQQGCRRL